MEVLPPSCNLAREPEFPLLLVSLPGVHCFLMLTRASVGFRLSVSVANSHFGFLVLNCKGQISGKGAFNHCCASGDLTHKDHRTCASVVSSE